MGTLDMALTIVFICVGIALVVFVIELIRILRTLKTSVDDVMTKVNPILDNAKTMTDDLVPAVAKADPMVDRLQLTIDAVNLEMMRLDEILEDVSQITDAAASATNAVDTITNAPIKAVSSVTSKVRSTLGSKNASAESAEIGSGNRSAVTQALEDYKAAQEADDADSTEPNFEGFEKLVSDEQPKELDELAADTEEAADGKSGDAAYFTYDDSEA